MREPRLYTTSADYAYQELRHRIITKQLKPGQRLPEVAIAVQMGVSRTPVREALRRLSSEGLVVIVPNSGARLASPTIKEIEDTYKVRDKLEQFSILEAAPKIGERHLRRLDEAIMEESRAFEERKLDVFLESYEIFHRMIAEASGNRMLAEYVANILGRTNAYVVFYDPFYEMDDNPTISEHRAIFSALKRHDVKKSSELMHSHLVRTVSCLKNSTNG